MATKKKAPAKRRGAPTKYDPDVHVPLARGLARAGYTMPEIAAEMHVGERTLYKWRTEKPELMQALKEGRELADYVIEDSLFNRAKGYKRKTVRRRKTPQGIVQEEVIEQVPPDTAACIFWLKNRQPDKWRDKREVDVTADSDAKIKATLKKMGL